jgi:hypothetical protein
MPPVLEDRTACLGMELLNCELLANRADVADVLVLNELRHSMKAWPWTLLDPCLLSSTDY